MSGELVTWVVVTYGHVDQAASLVRSIGQHQGLRFILSANGVGDGEAARGLLGDRSDVVVVDAPHNPGYLGALREAAHDIDVNGWVVLSNADLTVGPGFWSAFCDARAAHARAAMLVPSVMDSSGRDSNPHLRQLPDRRKMTALQMLHRWPRLADLVSLRRQGHSSRPAAPVEEGQSVFVGHGSCLVFGPNYRALGSTWDYPQRLFGEELWCGTEMARTGGRAIYVSSVQLRHREHASTGARGRRGDVARWKYESLAYWGRRARREVW